MAKTLTYKLFGVGKMPREYRDGLEYFEEGIKATMFFRNYRAPWKYFHYRKMWFSGALGYSNEGVIGFLRKQEMISIEFINKLYKKLKIEIADDHVLFSFNSEDFRPETSGEIEIKYYVEHPEKFKEIIKD